MKKIFSFTKKKKHPSGTPDNGSVLSAGYELKDKDLAKVHKAASVGDLAKLKQLAKKNDINQLDKENRTALHIACAGGHVDVVQFLVESKAKLNLCDNQNRSALMKAVQGQHERCVSMLLENHAEPNLVDINGNTALHLAANIPSISTAVLLLEHGADVNTQNKEGFVPLTVAVREDHIEMAEFLLNEGADVNAVDRDQRSLLMVAAGNGQISMLRLLLRFSADITLKDAKGWSADDYAGMNGHHPCSLLINEHSTQRNDGASQSFQPPNKKKKKTLLGSPSQDCEAGFSLGGPATDKDDGGNEAGGDFDDNSQSESLSRVSKSAGDEWPSSDDDDDESVLVEKKVNLRKLIASDRREASALPNRSLSGSESEPESENRVQRIPYPPQTSQHPVDPCPVSFLPKVPQMTSTPLQSYRKKEEYTDEEGEKENEEQEEEGETSDENHQPERSGEPLKAPLPVPESDGSQRKKRDFLSELGLEKEEEEEEPDSWDLESCSESPKRPHEEKQSLRSLDQEETSAIKEENKDAANSTSAYREHVEQDETLHKEMEKTKWEPLSVLSKLQSDKEQTTDVMEELGLGDVDDLEDASDWDSASTTSKRTLPGRRITSPGLEEFPECSVKEEDEDEAPGALLISSKTEPDPPPQSVPHPQPRARRMVPQKAESEDESDWEPNAVACSSNMDAVDSQLQTVAELQATVTPASPEFSPKAGDRRSQKESDEKHGKAVRETVRMRMEEQKSTSSWDSGGAALEESRTEKPESRLGSLSSPVGAIPLEQQPETIQRLSPAGKQKNEDPEEVGMAEDLDELTQSSDTATDDIDSPTSGYRHASLLIQKLDSAALDSRSMVELQNIFHEYERSIQKARSRHGYLMDKVSQLEMEREELKSSLEEVKDVKSVLERSQLELQTEVTNTKFQLKQEQENRRNANMMYNNTKDMLRRTEEQYQLEVQERQKVELTLRNLELETRTLLNNMKQLEDDHTETQRLLAQERSARMLQENLLNSHLRKQQEMEDEHRRNISRSTEALSQLSEASDREKELLQQTATLQEQLTLLRAELERSQASSSLKESHLVEENETLKEQLEDTRRDLKLNGEALTQTVYNCNNQVTALKSELAMTATRSENEQQSRKTLETELESVRSRLAGAVKEAELRLAAHTETERTLLREKNEHQRLKDKLSGEAASQREAVSSLSQKLSKAESRANSLENEVHRASLQLTEKGILLDVLQQEKDQAVAQVKELETTLQAERELVIRAGARQEATQERLAQAQSEGMLLRQQLEESQNKGVAKERAVTDAQERFGDLLSKLRSDCEGRVQLVEERNKELASKAADLRDQIYKLEEEKSEREASLRQLQQELADSLKRLSMSEASLEVNTRYRSDLEEEKTRLLKDLDRLKGKLEDSEDQYVQAERQINSLKSSLDEKGKELTVAAHKLQEALSTSAASDSTIKQLEDAVQRLEIENARLEAAAKQQSNKIEALQKGAHEATVVRGRLEDLVTNLQSSKMTLEDQLNREVQKQSMLSHTAQDSQALWEEELKSRSKLGLRLAELEKEKGELSSQMEMEKKKAKKVMEQKKVVDSRLDQEMKRNTELQKEMYRLRTLLKTAKKKMRDQDAGRAEFGSPMSSLRVDQSRQSEGFGRMKEKVEDLQAQLEKEQSRRSQLERLNGELKDQLSSMKSLNQSNHQQERSKRQLEEEVLDLRRRMEAAQMEQSHVEQYRCDAEDRARQEIQQKLEQVNLFLQSQAASQEALDRIQAANEANLRSQLEQKIRELEVELGRARTMHQDSINQRDSTHTELERYRQLHAEELRQRKSLTAKLERANSRLQEANSKLLNERSRSLISSSIANGSLAGPSLDVGSLGSPAHYGPLNRSLGLGLSFLSPVSEARNSSVEDYLAKMQRELEREVTKELNNATAELYVTSARASTAGSASGAELDPVSSAKQQYLEVLKKNYMI